MGLRHQRACTPLHLAHLRVLRPQGQVLKSLCPWGGVLVLLATPGGRPQHHRGESLRLSGCTELPKEDVRSKGLPEATQGQLP